MRTITIYLICLVAGFIISCDSNLAPQSQENVMSIVPDSGMTQVNTQTTFRIVPKNFKLPANYDVEWLMDTARIKVANTDSLSFSFKQIGIHTIKATLFDSVGNLIATAHTIQTDTTPVVDTAVLNSFRKMIVRFEGDNEHFAPRGNPYIGSFDTVFNHLDTMIFSLITNGGFWGYWGYVELRHTSKISFSPNGSKVDSLYFYYNTLEHSRGHEIVNTACEMRVSNLPLSFYTQDSIGYEISGTSIKDHFYFTAVWYGSHTEKATVVVDESGKYNGTNWNGSPKPKLTITLYR